jgi:C4-dicarboxylate transporter DctQ subunit
MNGRAAFTRLVDLLGTLIFIVITLVASAQIINRYCFGNSFDFAEELSVQLMIWIAFLGAAKCVAENAHTRLSVVVDKLAPRPRCLAMLLSNVLSIAFLGVAAWYGFRLVATTWAGTTTGTHIPEGLVYLAMPFSSLIMIFFLLENCVGSWREFQQLGGSAR